MKRWQAFFLTMTVLATSLSGVSAIAEESEADIVVYDGLEYEMLSDAFAHLVGSADKTITSVTIPAEVEGFPVWADSNCFFDCPDLEEILVEENTQALSSIDGVLFFGGTLIACPCARQGTYVVPDNADIGFIGSEAFRNCKSLTEITIPETVRVESEAFRNCTALERFTNPMLLVGGSAFVGCRNLQEVDFVEQEEPSSMGIVWMDGLDSICTLTIPENYYFHLADIRNCSMLTELRFHNVIFGNEDFLIVDCPALTSLVMPDEPYETGDFVISGCNSLESLTAPYARNFSMIECENIKAVTFSPHHSSKRDKCHYDTASIENCENLTDIILDTGLYSGVKLSGCPNLKNVYFCSVNSGLSLLNITDAKYTDVGYTLAENGVTVHCRRASTYLQEECESYGVPYTIIEDEVVPGDATNDGTVDILDVVVANKHILGKEPLQTIPFLAADVNGDNVLEPADSLQIMRRVVGLE